MTAVTLSFDQLVYLQRASATVRSYLSFITTAKGCIAAETLSMKPDFLPAVTKLSYQIVHCNLSASFAAVANQGRKSSGCLCS